MSDELIAGAAQALKNAIHPLAYPQLVWDGKPRQADSLYQRMRDALTAATTQSGAPMQASKAPARIDVMCWFVTIDHDVAVWQDGHDTLDRLDRLATKKWTPDDVQIVKLMTSRCESWAHQARELLGDNPVVVPIRKPCPACSKLWCYSGPDQTRNYALQVSESGAYCRACRAKWITDQEISVFIKMLG